MPADSLSRPLTRFHTHWYQLIVMPAHSLSSRSLADFPHERHLDSPLHNDTKYSSQSHHASTGNCQYFYLFNNNLLKKDHLEL
jgi:hypothetical protein